ncbi:bifunctional phosphopantothenoylcysteine decarboxylase/phosphopantothenate--cysteine ligase CoaBC [Paraclostridium bifermentans]|uniref:bifunctional phosphopantothenoylcysteine decarboxylase/phosphopantothenate--cysteine ligase CoaBC n=1 Tax=Paraclostridium bifermentans TaxID=1490 RepID=UPI00038CA994|nr:bifunctional phosphopantothenoylcysteine decarboxylase/phosphopantothenate--cysteine ligase CoaBC [Paraclostridium bifermentans]EQK45226.1 phosphopantothenoylcysteine decarboxylase / phosphopantothenate--cysteine ligase [[Clostridium] bifermentans ATCC 19299] [Paraclostridium bifermentans ATCC 19299]MCE9675560.1 bifunctional phosphopantothenoylcysteine decarboxylase/phosphopantothenate--cysteine ligase CoaBC [Paraclostridium bifermentans]MCR1876096.1 bifunctional phosphopantothenoylcysteine d
MLKDKTIVIGVCGGIAVYKACDLVSKLKKTGVNVHVIMTKSATEFVAPLTFQTLSQNYVVEDMFESPKTWDVEHISLAKKADVFVLAPATANVIGKVANGIADDMLTTTIMATKAKVLVAPAMNTNMYENPVVQRNIQTLKDLDYKFVEPESGRLACGDIGSGKLASVDTIFNSIIELLEIKKDLEGTSMIITAGPTVESIDPVRYITNRSTGKMGYSIAKKAIERGADVTLVSGPTNIVPPQNLKKFIQIESAEDMYNAVLENMDENQVIIKSAAVADYRPKEYSDNKIKKSDDDLSIRLDRTKDIALELGKIKNNKILVGFAAETNDLLENAKNKIQKKNLDFIVANDLTQDGAGFGVDTNIVKIIDREGVIQEHPKMKKEEVADVILDKIKTLLNK